MDEKKGAGNNDYNSSVRKLSTDSAGRTETSEPDYPLQDAPEEEISEEGLSKKEREKILAERSAAREKKMESSRKDSIREGCATSVMSGFGENNINAFAVKLGATDIQIGFVNSFPLLIASFFQLFSVQAIDRLKSRKKVIMPAVLLQALTWLGITAVALYFRNPILLIIFFTLEITFKIFAQPAWSSMLGDITDEKSRGKFFGFRNKIAGATNFAAALIAGRAIFMFARNKNPEYLFYGFAVIFFLSFIARVVSWIYIRRIYDKPIAIDTRSQFSFWQFVRKMTKNNFGIFVLFICVFDFTVYLAAPFFTAYMLNELGMDMWTYTLVNASTAIFTFLVMTYWGRNTDMFGNKKVFQITGYMIPLVPLLFILWKNPYYLFAVNALSGFVWAGFNLSYTNYMYDAVTPQKRVRCMAYYNFLDGASIFLGATAGAIIMSLLAGGVKFSGISLSKYHLIFIISAVLRLASMIFFLPKIREVRMGLPDVSSEDLFVKLIAVEPLKETAYMISNGVKGGVSRFGKLGKDFVEFADIKKAIKKRKEEKKKRREAEKSIKVKNPEDIGKK
jgi:MFS family permease